MTSVIVNFNESTDKKINLFKTLHGISNRDLAVRTIVNEYFRKYPVEIKS